MSYRTTVSVLETLSSSSHSFKFFFFFFFLQALNAIHLVWAFSFSSLKGTESFTLGMDRYIYVNLYVFHYHDFSYINFNFFFVCSLE